MADNANRERWSALSRPVVLPNWSIAALATATIILDSLLFTAIGIMIYVLTNDSASLSSNWAMGFFIVAILCILLTLILFTILLIGSLRSTRQDTEILFPPDSVIQHLAWEERLEWESKVFTGFVPRKTQGRLGGESKSWLGEEVRQATEKFGAEKGKGLFLSHSWRAPIVPSQIADIAITLCEGLGTDTPVRLDDVKSVKYELWPDFEHGNFVKSDNRATSFSLKISAHRPVLCLATVTYTDKENGRSTKDLKLYRYIDFF